MNTRSSNITILLGFSVVLILLISLMLLSLWSISENTTRIEDIVAEQGEVKDVFSMRDAAQRRSLMLYRMLTIEDEFERDEQHMAFKDQAGIFIGARDSLLSKLNKDESEVWDGAKMDIAKGARVQGEAVKFILNNRITEATDKIITEVIPTQDTVMVGLTDMLDLMNKRTNEELELAEVQNKNAYMFTIILGGIAFVIGIAAMFYVMKHNVKTEKLLTKQQQLAEEASVAKSHFLANMSHEIRTPLTAIIGFSENLLIDNFNKDNREQLGNAIVRNGKHLLQLINDILDISKIEAGELAVEHIETSPSEITAELESIIGMQARDKGLLFNLNYQFPIPRTIMSDPTRLKQILINLCGNAIKFTDTGSITIETSCQTTAQTMTFLIKDTGIGMTEEECSRIFKPFAQADASTTRKHGGTGLGLSISKQLSEKMGGKLECFSRKGKGSCFKVVVSTGDLDLNNMMTKLEEAVNIFDNSDCTTKRLQGNILLAEDSPDNQELITMYTNRTGANLTIVNNGEEAVEAGMVSDYDLILMDMQMPIMDGIEAITLLRASGYAKPIVTLTANVMAEDRQQCLDAGADGFLSKPIDLKKFYATLNKYLEEENGDYKNSVTDNLHDDPVYQELVNKFVVNLPSMFKEMEEAFEKSDWEALQSLSHKLKGVGGSFGFHDITDKAAIINHHCLAGKYTDMAKLVDDLAQSCSVVESSRKTA